VEVLTLPLVAVAAGILSFSSPCCLPLVPGYLSYMSALPVSELGERDARRVTLKASLLFVAGFSTVFTAFGVAATLLGNAFLRNQDGIVRVFGVFIIVLGLATIGVLKVPFLMRERRVDMARVPKGTAWAFPMGMAFAAGWAPCIGPVLATILATAAVSGTVAWGAFLLALYSLGMGIPFVLLALGFSRAQRSLDWLRRNGRAIEVIGGLLLVGVGTLFVSGRWNGLFRPLQRWAANPNPVLLVLPLAVVAALFVPVVLRSRHEMAPVGAGVSSGGDVAVLPERSHPSGTGETEAPGGRGGDSDREGGREPVPAALAGLRRTRRALWIAVAVAVPLALLVVVLATRPATRSVDSPLLGKPAPAAASTTVDGNFASLADLRGKWVVVNFFATWCVPCRMEHPDLVRFSQQHQAAGDATVFAVVYDDSASAVRDFRAKEGGEWPMLTDPKGRIALDFGVSGVPESFVIDPSGRVVSKVLGGVQYNDLEALLAKLKQRGG